LESFAVRDQCSDDGYAGEDSRSNERIAEPIVVDEPYFELNFRRELPEDFDRVSYSFDDL
jgi:hypothetical protein